VNASVLIALLNPSMLLILSAAFALIAYHQHQHRYIAHISYGLIALAAGFTLQYFPRDGQSWARILSYLLLIGGGLFLVVGSLGRYRRRPPLTKFLVVGFVGLASCLWFMFGQPAMNTRVLALNFIFGLFALMLAHEIHSTPARKPIDRMLCGVVAVFGISFFVRPVSTYLIEGPYTTYEGFFETIYWLTLVFSTALFMLVYALTMMTAIVLDIVEELHRKTLTDPLSGLLNRRGFEESAERLIRHARRRHLPLSLVVCDLDHFKVVNDTHGHDAGDRVIVAFAQCLINSVGKAHVVARLGGEEFAILLSGATLGTARLLAEGTRTVFSVTQVPGVEGNQRFTASFGVAEIESGEDISDVLVRADAALYEAKKMGRNRVRVAKAEEADSCVRLGVAPVPTTTALASDQPDAA
jgi:diguanylate cyclase (GGDEF)-like protein